MYRVAICDDHQEAILDIQMRIDNYIKKYRVPIIETNFINPHALLANIDDGFYYDLIFIDIEMPINGITIIREIRRKMPVCLIVIVSSHRQYAISAIELEIFRYLVKGYLDETFEVCLEAAFKRIDISIRENYYILSTRKHIKLSCKDIIYCYKDSKMSVFVTKTGEIKERKTLQNVLKDLIQICDYFIMIERGYIVNLHFVNRLEKNELFLDDGSSFTIGITFLDDVKRKINNFWRKQL